MVEALPLYRATPNGGRDLYLDDIHLTGVAQSVLAAAISDCLERVDP